MDTIDLRSDTVTLPTPQMYEAMANARLGDDVYGEDPTVNELEGETAAMFKKEAALFVSSGTQGNLLAVMAHCERGDEIIVGKQAHMFLYEAGSASSVAGVQINTIDVQTNGTLKLDDIRAAIRMKDVHEPRTHLICLENTQNVMGGVAFGADYIRKVAALAHMNQIKVHMDGARIFNAATAVHMPVHELIEDVDSISFCLSKGLCAPVGSVLVGRREFIEKARRFRKMLGGGMRQAGILAAAGLVALREMTKRLHEDHENARLLADGLAKLPYIQLDPTRVQTNMIYFTLAADAPVSTDALVQHLKAKYNIYISPAYNKEFRFVTHYWITPERVYMVLKAMQEALQG